MFKLTSKMLGTLEDKLSIYHNLFKHIECKAEWLEELIFSSIKPHIQDTDEIYWKPGGHDKHTDIKLSIKNTQHNINIKAGKISVKKELVLSGHRTGSYDSLEKKTNFLNNPISNIISVPYKKENKQHIYKIYYIDKNLLTKLNPNEWKQRGKAWEQTNEYGVIFSLRPSMSWQIWWFIPISLVTDNSDKLTIG